MRVGDAFWCCCCCAIMITLKSVVQNKCDIQGLHTFFRTHCKKIRFLELLQRQMWCAFLMKRAEASKGWPHYRMAVVFRPLRPPPQLESPAGKLVVMETLRSHIPGISVETKCCPEICSVLRKRLWNRQPGSLHTALYWSVGSCAVGRKARHFDDVTHANISIIGLAASHESLNS